MSDLNCRRLGIVITLSLFILTYLGLAQLAHCQRVNTFYANQQPGKTVGAKVDAAQKQRNPSMPCTVIIDADLSAFAVGTMPTRAANCTWIDYRTTPPEQTPAPPVQSYERLASDYCAVPGVYDDTCIRNAIAALPNGGTVRVGPPGTAYLIFNPIVVQTSGLGIEGMGSSANSNSGPGTPAATRLYSGINGADKAVFKFSPVTGADKPNLKRNRLANLSIDCQSLTGMGLQLESANYGEYRNLYLSNCPTSAIDLVPTSGALAEFRDVQKNRFENISIRQYEANGNCFRLRGDLTANSSENTFTNNTCDYGNGDGLRLENADNNKFYATTGTRSAGGTGIGIHLTSMVGGDGTSQTSAREELFFGVDIGAGGLVSDQNATGSVVFGYMRGNGAPEPVAVPGTLSWTSDGLPGTGWNTWQLLISTIKSVSGRRYVCVDTDGKLVSQAAACSGT